MPIQYKIKKFCFQDALRLMRISKTVREMDGVKNAVAVMATDKAKFAVEDAGLMTPEIREASGSDLAMVVDAESDAAASDAIAQMEEFISAGAEGGGNAPDILSREIRVINIGLQTFAEALSIQGVKTVHVNWRAPAGGDEKLINILKAMS